MTVIQLQPADNQKLGNHDCMPWNHHRGQVQEKDQIPSRKLQPGKSVGAHGAEGRLEHNDNQRNFDGIQVISQERIIRPELYIVFYRWIGRNPLNRKAHDGTFQFKGGGKRPEERHDHGNSQQQQDNQHDRVNGSDLGAVFHLSSPPLSPDR